MRWMMRKYIAIVITLNIIVGGLLGYNLMVVVGLGMLPTIIGVLLVAVCITAISIAAWIRQ
jgi:hypothetical protein